MTALNLGPVAPTPDATPPTIEGFVAAARRALASASPQQAMRALLQSTVTLLSSRSGRWIEHEGDELLLVAGPALTVYHIALSPGIHYPPHDHRMPAVIGLYRGTETSFSYRRNGKALVRTARHDHAAPCVATLPADAIHSVVNMGDEPSAAIHVYFGNLPAIERSIWDADLHEERPFDNRYYFDQARRL
jgi:predicted metal-dependent enzyme (double-stranded beta helix superfamily)